VALFTSIIRRLLIANLGEIAMRILHACRALGIETIAVYSDAEAEAPFKDAVDESIRIGPPRPSESYLSIAKIIDAARVARADAIHPGYRFLSEDAEFASACVDMRIILVEPPAEVMASMVSMIESRRLLQDTGVPVVPGGHLKIKVMRE
jgi:acetyl/propionyl-CoA carboxylase alpha subunit